MTDPYGYTSPQEDTSYSRKRPYNSDKDYGVDGDNRGRESKRFNSNSGPEQTPLLKVLIPNYAAGAIIGKGGSNIGAMQERYGAKVRLSPSGEFYPGTEERIIILSGEISQILELNTYIISKVKLDSADHHGHGPGRHRDGNEDRGEKVKIVVPNMTAGLVIGRGGASIKAMQDETKAKIMITGRDESKVPGERIITVAGTEEQRIEACKLVISKIADDKENMLNKNLTYSNMPMRGVNGSPGGGGGGGGGYHHGSDINPTGGLQGGLSALGSMIGNLQHQTQHNNQSLLSALAQNPLAALQQSGLASQLGLGASSLGNLGAASQQLPSLSGLGQSVGSVINSIKTTVTISMEIPDILVGAILGKQGKTVHEFIQFSGAKIQFSAKNDFAPGTTDRILTIQGDLNQTQIAYFLINQKIMQAENELASGLQRR